MAKRNWDTFRRGQLVTWKNFDDKKLKERITALEDEIGEGPFLVGSVKLAENPEKIGHHQVLTLRCPDDLTRIFSDEIEFFSGGLFKVYDKEES